MKVVHCRKDKFDIYIGRPSKWGNPFTIGEDGNRDEVIEKYRKYILANPKLLNDLHELKGKTLGCWCSPNACHGDVLIELIENIDKMKIDEVDVVILMCKYLNCEINSTRYNEIKEFVYGWFDDRE